MRSFEMWMDHAGRQWSQFWFRRPCLANLAFLRMATGLMWFYALSAYTLDLSAHLGSHGWANPEDLAGSSPFVWSFSAFHWVNSLWWWWFVHLSALLTASALILGIHPTISGLLSLFFHLSYMHRNPVVVLEMDHLITFALVYTTLAPTARQFAIDPLFRTGQFRYSWEDVNPIQDSEWGSLILRLMQIHLCLLYVHAALAKMDPSWLSGASLTHPRLEQRGFPLGWEWMTASPEWTVLFSYGLVIWMLLYPVLIWVPRLRTPLVTFSILLHVVVGVVWGQLAFNLMMAALNTMFFPPEWVVRAKNEVREALGMPWFPSGHP
ncbi:MAG: HTTM domain-containing protein [Deltaproteobacteria bacterium]|nr:HTTM domain-containing protein [Deltaproteobacteria bacterium]